MSTEDRISRDVKYFALKADDSTKCAAKKQKEEQVSNERHVLDIYYPNEEESKDRSIPVLIHVHGIVGLLLQTLNTFAI